MIARSILASHSVTNFSTTELSHEQHRAFRMSNPEESTESRSGRVAIVGRPNTGKSTLLNALVGQTLAVATSRPGTTRTSILGVYYRADPETQIAFVDTPGMGHSKTALHRLLVDEAARHLSDVDAIVMVTAVDEKAHAPAAVGRDQRMLKTLHALGESCPVLLVLNKVDLIQDKRRLLPVLKAYEDAFPFKALIPLSAKSDTSFEGLVQALRDHLDPGLMYEPEFLTDRPERFFVAEFIRAAAMRNVRDELPYGIAVTIERFEDGPRHTTIEATLVVERESHKGIVIGKKGAMLKRIGSEAREAIEAHLERHVFVKLWVKVVTDWTRDPTAARDLLENS